MVLGFLKIGAFYSVRGRRAQILPVSVRLSLFTPAERKEARKQLAIEAYEEERADSNRSKLSSVLTAVSTISGRR